MTDQELVVAALRDVGSIIADYLEQSTTDADDTIAQLVALLDTEELANAMSRLERGYGLRVIK
jgi:DNA integrity scanning protein DisA with diadenylate cyclase activity